jgi:hypothetical protein
MAALGYATVGSNRLRQAQVFYDALFGPVGIVPMFEHASGGPADSNEGALFFGVPGPYDGKPATVGNGSMSAFRFDGREHVDALQARALELGGADEGAAGERAPKMHFSYLRDLDGNKLCAFNLG